MKAAFDWKVQKNLRKGKGEKGKKVLHFKESFHGRGGYTVSVTNTSDPNKYKYFALFDWPRVFNPKVTFPLTGKNLEKAIQDEAKAISQIKGNYTASLNLHSIDCLLMNVLTSLQTTWKGMEMTLLAFSSNPSKAKAETTTSGPNSGNN